MTQCSCNVNNSSLVHRFVHLETILLLISQEMGNTGKKCHEVSGSFEVRKDFEKAYNEICQRQETLDNYLIQLDDSKKVDYSSSQTIAEQAECYATQILHEVQQQDARFKSTFLCSGSFYDEVKVGFPNEYDYMAKLELLSKAGIGRAVPTKLGFAQLVLEDPESIDLWKEFLGEDTNENGEVIKNVLSIMMLSHRFTELVDTAMKLVAMPQNWRRNPCSLLHGPCALLMFLVDGFHAEHPLNISIDLAPCITYPNYRSVQFPFYKYLKDKSLFTLFLENSLATGPEVLLVPFMYDGVERVSESSWSYIYRDQMRVSFSMLEKAIFSQFASNSMEKRLLRILKVLRDGHLRDDGSMEDWEKPLPEGVFPDEPPSTIVKITSVEQITPITDEQESERTSCSELAEGEINMSKDHEHEDLLQTYIFKSLFFYTKLYQDQLFSGSLSGVVLECLKTLFDVYSTPQSTVGNFFFDGYTSKTPNERNRGKIIRRLAKIVAHLQKQIALE